MSNHFKILLAVAILGAGVLVAGGLTLTQGGSSAFAQGFGSSDDFLETIREQIKEEVKEEINIQLKNEIKLETQEQITENMLIPRVVETGVGKIEFILPYSGTSPSAS